MSSLLPLQFCGPCVMIDHREHVQENAGVHWRRLHACPREHRPLLSVPAALRRDPVLHRLRGGKNGRVQFPLILSTIPTLNVSWLRLVTTVGRAGARGGAGRGQPPSQPASQPASQPTAYGALATRGQGENSLKGAPPERTSKSTFSPQYFCFIFWWHLITMDKMFWATWLINELFFLAETFIWKHFSDITSKRYWNLWTKVNFCIEQCCHLFYTKSAHLFSRRLQKKTVQP